MAAISEADKVTWVDDCQGRVELFAFNMEPIVL